MLDLEQLRGWIGRTEMTRDLVSVRLVREFCATLDIDSGLSVTDGDPAPPGIHWCLGPSVAVTSILDQDGHPPRGSFLPPIPLPRRMWAGSAIRFQDRLRVGDAVERRSRIADVAVKNGRSGSLCFVAVEHETWSNRGLAIAEQQDIVYRGASIKADARTETIPIPRIATIRQEVTAGPALLFRYSALTFNGHRIHYDREYAKDVEGYPGLLVQGPLQATQLLTFATAIRRQVPRSFVFRAVRPLIEGMLYRLCARNLGAAAKLWIETEDHHIVNEAQARW